MKSMFPLESNQLYVRLIEVFINHFSIFSAFVEIYSSELKVYSHITTLLTIQKTKRDNMGTMLQKFSGIDRAQGTLDSKMTDSFADLVCDQLGEDRENCPC